MLWHLVSAVDLDLSDRGRKTVFMTRGGVRA
jgi:hypothetical protein